jgi:hypothetical protein
MPAWFREYKALLVRHQNRDVRVETEGCGPMCVPLADRQWRVRHDPGHATNLSLAPWSVTAWGPSAFGYPFTSYSHLRMLFTWSSFFKKPWNPDGKVSGDERFKMASNDTFVWIALLRDGRKRRTRVGARQVARHEGRTCVYRGQRPRKTGQVV